MKAEKKLFRVQFQPVGKRADVTIDNTILDAATQAGIGISSACGGEASCGQCRVILVSGSVNPPQPVETFLLNEFDLMAGYRLACCTQVLDNLTIQVPKEAMVSGQRLQIESNLVEIDPDPLIQPYPIQLSPPTLDDPRSDLRRLFDELESHHGLSELIASSAVIRDLPVTLRTIKWQGETFIKDGEILTVRPPGQKPLGLAIDLGTTKIAAYLMDLESGKNLASMGVSNPQSRYGDDVINRLTYAIRKPEGSRELATLIRNSFVEILEELCEQTGLERQQVADACVVGNTAMIHLLLDLPVRQLAHSPYVAACSNALEFPAGELGLAIAPGASVHIPPNIGGFVGSDHVAMMLASLLDRTEKVTLGIDIGTNTEISIRSPSSTITAVSCASGPAFEGAHIKDGMRAASGAIEKVRINDHNVEFTTVNDQPPVGICGSGILDTVAELYRVGWINAGGRFQHNNDNVRQGDQGPEFVLVPAAESDTNRDIVITQKDVNEILLAIGAINAGTNILLKFTETAPESVEEVIVAGAFGAFLNIENSIQVGLFPNFPNAHFRQVGNAAALGAQWMLISKAARERSQEIARNTRYLELTTYPKFNRLFAEGMIFPDRK